MKPIGMMKPIALKDEDKANELFENGWAVEMKYDGFGTQAIVDETGLNFYARTPAKHGFSEYTKHITHLQLATASLPNGYYFGELIIKGVEASKLCTLHGDIQLTKDLMEEKGLINFVVYDYITSPLDKTNYKNRRDRLETIISEVGNSAWSISERIITGVEIEKAINLMHAGKIEGLIFKDKDSQYMVSDKSRAKSCWKKLKGSHPDDVVVFGAEPGQGKYEGMIGALRVGKYVKGEPHILATVSGMTDKERKDFEEKFFVEDDTYEIIEPFTVEISYMEKTHLGNYRHPRYIRMRPDKPPAECTMDVEDKTKGIKTLDQF